MRNRDRKNNVPTTVTSIPLVDPHALPANASIGELVRDATTQVSTLVRAEVELAKAEITRDVKKGLTGSVFFIVAGVVLLYSTFFMFFFLAELLDTWMWRWAAFLTVFILMLLVTALFALLGYRKVRRIRGPQQAIESVKETTAALTPSIAKFAGTPSAPELPATRPRATTSAPESRPLAKPRPAAPAPQSAAPRTSVPQPRPAAPAPAPTPTAPAPRATPATPAGVVVPEKPAHEADTEPYRAAHEETPAEAVVYEPPGIAAETVVSTEETLDEAVVYEAPEGYPETVVHRTPETATEIVLHEQPAPHGPADDPNKKYDPTAAVLADPDAPATLDSDRLPRDPAGW